MTLHPPTRRRRLAVVIIGVVTIALAAILGVTRPWMPPAETAPIAAAADGLSPAPLALPEHPKVLVFGDSWTYGSAATVPTRGYAYLLADLIDGETIVRGVPGSGYQRPGSIGPVYGERVKALDARILPDLIIIQGSINDRREDPAGYAGAVGAVWDAMVAKFPDVPIAILGPAPHELPVGASTARIDRDLATLAAARNWWYISPVQEKWITDENYLDVIDVGPGRKHPSNAGHEYLAQKLAEALDRLGSAPVTAADGSTTQPAK
ncbi:SGNH/GDSL hydrolase family protein [Microbacterium sp. H1-D42]|uniref:SGNH/GDSL hydrolase family protein n=1 Tax=Microbacterium sp. H1-D42 TaxID=2925844 RepID=UPI001F52C042|nr:SGNH/GDSL hydrolase family protein [Microbacterium sp. H1-D42]UNK69636.1 SGNH/GDSL hydrolase family protein [Microbacterium sp. H1-D42]